jgi:hypothetical protein
MHLLCWWHCKAVSNLPVNSICVQFLIPCPKPLELELQVCHPSVWAAQTERLQVDSSPISWHRISWSCILNSPWNNVYVFSSYYYLFECKWVLHDDSGTTIKHDTNTHVTQNNTLRSNKTQHTKVHTHKGHVTMNTTHKRGKLSL